MITDSLAMVDFAGTVGEAQNAIAQVNMVLDAINNGDGTLSQLLNDSTMYNNVNLMLDQATTLVEKHTGSSKSVSSVCSIWKQRQRA